MWRFCHPLVDYEVVAMAVAVDDDSRCISASDLQLAIEAVARAPVNTTTAATAATRRLLSELFNI